MNKIIDADLTVETNLQVKGDLNVANNLHVARDIIVDNNLVVHGRLVVKGILTTTVQQEVIKFHYNYQAVPPNFLGRLKWLLTGKLPTDVESK